MEGTDLMLEHVNLKTMRSHAQLVSVSKARAVVIFVVLLLGRKSRAREASEVSKKTGMCLAEERLKRCLRFTDREREIEAKIVARKILVEDAVTWNSGILTGNATRQ